MQLSELGDDCHLVIELNTMTASLVLDDDSPPCEEMKLRRTNDTSQWLWYWQHDDNSWRSYTEVSILNHHCLLGRFCGRLHLGCKLSGNLIFPEIFWKFPEILAKAWTL